MIEKFEIKINNLKKKINKKALAVVIFMVFTAICIFSVEMTNNFKRAKQSEQDVYNKAMYEMVGYVNNVENELAKLEITSTPKMMTTTLASIWKNSNLAKENLETLPSSQNSMSNASKYLSQLSDYCYSLLKQTVAEEKLTDEQFESIDSLYESSKELASVMQDIYDDLNKGRIKWNELEKVSNEEFQEDEVVTTTANISKIGKTFQEYEGLIYDGAFSDHLLNQTPKFLTGEEVSVDTAKKKVEEIFKNEEIEYISDLGDSSGLIDLYNFEVKLKNKENIKNISITKKDARLYLMVSDRKVESENISMDEAKKKGLDFLNSLGIYDVKDTYYLKTENMAIINYAGTQDGVILYPDLIKVKVALDDGEICSVESQGYIFNHTNRSDIKPTISVQTAKKVLNNNIEVISEDIAIIPTESKNEILTYEFKGKMNKKEFLIYINAKTGEEERVLLILETEGGILTM